MCTSVTLTLPVPNLLSHEPTMVVNNLKASPRQPRSSCAPPLLEIGGRLGGGRKQVYSERRSVGAHDRRFALPRSEGVADDLHRATDA